MKRQACAAAVLAVLMSPAFGGGPSCDQKTTKGTWVARCDGELPGPGGLASTRLLGTCTASKEGYWTCTANANLGGVRIAQALVGQAQNHADCTGFISHQQTFNGFPGPQLDIDFVILEGGDEIWGLPRPANPGEVVSCSLKRLSKDLPR